MMKQKTIDCLIAAGWTPDREISLDKYLKAYEEERLVLHEPARDFLRRFGDLIIPYRDETFDRDDIIGTFAVDTVCGYGTYLDRDQASNLNPIGDFWHDAVLMMDDRGVVWGETIMSNILMPIADSGEEALDRIINWQREDCNRGPYAEWRIQVDEEVKGRRERIKRSRSL